MNDLIINSMAFGRSEQSDTIRLGQTLGATGLEIFIEGVERKARAQRP